MDQDLKKLFGKNIHAPDGDLGQVKDFLVDENAAVVRYLVVDTAGWLPERQILLPPQVFLPHGFGPDAVDRECLESNLMRMDIERGPAVRSHHTISREYEESYYAHFGWHPYWIGGRLWGESSMPQAFARPFPAPGIAPVRNPTDDVHLQSFRKILGYHLQASDRAIGELCGATMNGHSWAIRDWVVQTGHWYAGKIVFILPESIERISHADSAVWVNLSWKNIRETVRDNVVEVGVSAG